MASVARRYKPCARITMRGRHGAVVIPKNFLTDHGLPFGRYEIVAKSSSRELRLVPTDKHPLVIGHGIVHLNTTLDTPMQVQLACRKILLSLGAPLEGRFSAPLRVEDGALVIDLGARVDESR